MQSDKLGTMPTFYNPERLGALYLPAMAEAYRAGEALRLPPARLDSRKIMLLLIDPQIDFIFPEGTLAVPGAIADTARTIEWIFRNVAQITNITISLDSHIAFQIFSPDWWINAAGEHPAPFTVISAEAVQKQTWQPLFEPEWSVSYVEALAKGGRYELMIWPFHTLIGTPGQAVVPALAETIMYQAGARQSQPTWMLKGSIPQTEYYSIFEPEVKMPGQPQGTVDATALERLATFDLIYIAGQAKSHCVLSSLRSIMEYFADRPDVIAKLRFLSDCTSSVQHPVIDFDALANAELAKMAERGMRLITSQDALE